VAGGLLVPTAAQAQRTALQPGQVENLAAMQLGLANAALAGRLNTATLQRPDVRAAIFAQQGLASQLVAAQRPAVILNNRRFSIFSPFFSPLSSTVIWPNGFYTYYNPYGWYTPDLAQNYYLNGLLWQNVYQNQALQQLAVGQQYHTRALHSLASEQAAPVEARPAPPRAPYPNGRAPTKAERLTLRETPGERELELARLWSEIDPAKAQELYEQAISRAPDKSALQKTALKELEALLGK
jgi:hypothetical protein